MSNIDKQDLLRAAVKIGAHTWGAEGPQVFSMSNGTADALVLEVFGDETSGQQDCDIASFIALANPSTVLALLDELAAKDRRIEEEIGRANREHHRGFMMACGHLKEHSNVHYADAAEMEIAALRNRINELESAAAGEGEAS